MKTLFDKRTSWPELLVCALQGLAWRVFKKEVAPRHMLRALRNLLLTILAHDNNWGNKYRHCDAGSNSVSVFDGSFRHADGH